jgi:glycosyltransferase involved in cell wall biosynthesis
VKLLLLSDHSSIHTIKWATSLSKSGVEVVIFGLGGDDVHEYISYSDIKVVTLNQDITRNEGSFLKFKYLKALPIINKIIKEFKPDVLHAHYSSSYGLLGALSGFTPFVLSVWGGDVFNFPKKSYLHKWILEFNLKKASKILSTSNVMAKEISIYTNKEITVTPFGVDLEVFKPMTVKSLFHKSDIVIGTIKTLEEKYGIEYLIKGFKEVSDRHPDLPLKLLIVGGGSLDNELKKLVKKLNLNKNTIFTGKVPFIDVPKYNNMLTVSVSVSISNSESFGVAIIEASACSKPVVVSNVGGLPEVVDNNISGFVVPPKNYHKTADAIERLILDKGLRCEFGNAGRKKVERFYNWNDNVSQMLGIYHSLFFKDKDS